MNSYRTEFRIFGLLLFALLASISLGLGIHSAQTSGELFGIRFFIAGPSAAFVVLLLLFNTFGLFKLGLEHIHGEELARPLEKMELEDIEDALDSITTKVNKYKRRRIQLGKAKTALEQGASEQEVWVASGMQPVQRQN